MICFAIIKPQPEHTAEELARAVRYPPGAASWDPIKAVPYRCYPVKTALEPITPDPPGAQRRAPKSEPAPGSRGGNLLRWFRGQGKPVRQGAITAHYGREQGSTLLRLVRQGHVQRRAVQFPTLAGPVYEYWASGRAWPAVAAGAVVVEQGDAG